MSTNASTVVIRGRRVGVLLVVIAALFLVPPIVRATSSIKSSSPIRLNRGFETPPSKADAATSLERSAEPVSIREPEPPHTVRRPLSRGESRVATPSDHSPDPQRGPPTDTLR
jgi:hypothetical protein